MNAFVSVTDKRGLIEFAQGLLGLGYHIYTTAGNSRFMQNLVAEHPNKLRVIQDLTRFPEILAGRIKSIHPLLYGGVLARRDEPEHLRDVERERIPLIDIICVNFYDFEGAVSASAPFATCIEQIDVGGPAIIRAAVKNHEFALPLVDPLDYPDCLNQLRVAKGATNLPGAYRRTLALKALQYCVAYDTKILSYLTAAPAST